ncbi:MAG: hypothetical protein CMH57_15470 [Myxococcales bacterium]|nr:hypothetical protein [Myxococcales bacterium]
MNDIVTLLSNPTEPTATGAWFEALAERLLRRTRLMIGARPHRLLEIEFYYHGAGHEDPFAHCDPLQQSTARWYFHRDEGSYRGGSFKGLDISFGPEGEFGGILIRTIEAVGGAMVNGCSLSVDHALAVTGYESVAALDAAIDGRSVWDASSPLSLVPDEGLEPRGRIWATGRVGLTLKRMARHPTMPEFLMKPYRFLTEPTIKKGKAHTIIAMHQAGLDVEAIRAATRSPRKTIQGYQEAYAEGEAGGELTRYRGKGFKTRDLCVAHGIWSRVYGA